MSMKEILQEIKCWNENRNNPGVISSLMSGIMSIQFSPGKKLLQGDDLHVYPAIQDNGKDQILKFYLISATYDTSNQLKQPDGLIPYIDEASILWNLADIDKDKIPADTAKARIYAWEHDFSSWLNISASHAKVFQAFHIPKKDLGYETIHAYFGLVPYTDEIAGDVFRADLVINPTDRGIGSIFEDTVMPVPPFGVNGALANSHFFLLNHALGK